MQRTRLAALKWLGTREADVERVRVADEMRRNNEPVELASRLEIVRDAYPRGGTDAEPAMLAALPAADHLRRFAGWSGRDLRGSRSNRTTSRGARGRGLCAAAALYRPSSSSNRPSGRIKAGLARCEHGGEGQRRPFRQFTVEKLSAPAHRVRRSSPRRSPVVRRFVAAARRADVRLVRFLYTETGRHPGQCHARRCLAERLTDASGSPWPAGHEHARQLARGTGWGRWADPLVPVPTRSPAALRSPRGGDAVDMRTLEGEPWAACPRDFLKRQIAAAAAAGFTVRAAFECEFSLAARRPDGAWVRSTRALLLDDRHDVSSGGDDDMVAALQAQGTRSSILPGAGARPA